jgi:hypothetical protein
MSNGFSWQIDIAPYGDASAFQGPLVGYTVQVTVARDGRSRMRDVRLVTLRLAQRGVGG